MRRSLLLTALLALPAALLLPASAAGQALDDPTIIAIFDAPNTADIETGTLAAKRAQSKDVRDYGAMIAHDHEAVRQMGRDLAKKLGVTPTPPAGDASAKTQAETMAALREKHGADFDRRWCSMRSPSTRASSMPSRPRCCRPSRTRS
jgi:putative membrane protein